MCDCIAEVNKKLAETGSNTEIDVPIVFSFVGKVASLEKVLIATRKRDDSKREKPKKLFGSYCPFCGKEYEESE